MAAFQSVLSSTHNLEFLVGRTATGESITADLNQLQHLLISGVSGSGKSVFLDSMLLTLLTNNSPQQLRLLLCDTKIISLSQWGRVAHLLIPLCTDRGRIAKALSWAADECQCRLVTMANSDCRKISSYNDRAWESFCPELPQIIIIVDDISEILRTQPESVESVRHILFAGRAVGIHLVAVTQTPTERNIKRLFSQFPGRVVFQSASPDKFHFMTQQKKIPAPLAPGDAVFCRGGFCQTVHIWMPEDTDLAGILGAVQENKPECDKGVLQKIQPDTFIPSEEPDPLLQKATEIIVDEGLASTSLLQRRLHIGYARAAHLIDELEHRGIVGPFEGSSPRRILITNATAGSEVGAKAATELEVESLTKATAVTPEKRTPPPKEHEFQSWTALPETKNPAKFFVLVIKIVLEFCLAAFFGLVSFVGLLASIFPGEGSSLLASSITTLVCLVPAVFGGHRFYEDIKKLLLPRKPNSFICTTNPKNYIRRQ